MTISPARLAANRANAQKSTGPRTEEGKARSRCNALRHGLRAEVVPVEDEAIARARLAGVAAMVAPSDEFQDWLCDRIAQDTVRLDRLRAMEREARADAADRAEVSWEEDQRVEADRLAAGLARDPARTVGELRRSVAGCDWLVDRWARLLDAAGRGPWTDGQRELAHDLLGTPPAFRADPPERVVDEDGRPVAPTPSQSRLARTHLDELHRHRDAVAEDDRLAQELAMADLDDFGTRDLRRLRRYERALLTDIKRAFAMARRQSPGAAGARPLPSTPARFLPPAAPDEPGVDVAPAPDEPRAPGAAEAADPAPRPPLASPAPDEPGVDAAPAPDEPVGRPAAVAPGRSGPAAPPRSWLTDLGLSPALAALLEDDSPESEDLDPDEARAYFAANLAAGRYDSLLGPGPPAARAIRGRADP